MARENPLNAEILLETLKRSSLNTVLIEGIDDSEIYQIIGDNIADSNISFLECNGRANLLALFDRKDELSNSNVLFLCDSDLWVIDGVPEKYQSDSLICTNGYSIENDIYSDGKHILQSLLRNNENIKLEGLVDSICKWYAHEISLAYKNGTKDLRVSDVTILSTNVMKRYSTKFEDEFLESRNYKDAEEGLSITLRNDFERKLRGKFIFQIFEKIFQERRKKSITYTRLQLFDIVVNMVLSDNLDESILVCRKNKILDFFN
ncbi:DUF4435 domain-containing protein [Sphingobacterium corticibacter]|uniref:Uncharacterized protein n=1 Tax=Sphingobacterium corticibacter TaxID=2171749 RepID=A0A2T8HK11_9SPHI|nr:DUF4435 domain-containing protein [Sphingobacterium corticibacter]PVH25779.1 hypothetical protein DC487_07550 [Sphingobacterium corticibacter]